VYLSKSFTQQRNFPFLIRVLFLNYDLHRTKKMNAAFFCISYIISLMYVQMLTTKIDVDYAFYTPSTFRFDKRQFLYRNQPTALFISNFLDVAIPSMSDKLEYLVKYSVAPPPSRDYYGLKVVQNEVPIIIIRFPSATSS